MLGTLVNAAAVLGGSLIGLFFKRGINEKYSDMVMKGLGMCTIYIGIDGALSGTNPLIAVISMLLGGLLGTLLDLTGRLERLGDRLQARFKKDDTDGTSFGQGFVTASLLNCVGAMAVLGALNDGLMGDHSLLFTKAALDFVPAIVMAASLGAGVCFSALAILVYQGAISIFASFAAPLLSEVVIAEMSCVGNILIIGLGLNILGVTKLKVMDYMPAMFIAILLCQFML